jgi:hypothetical protein
VRAPNFGSGQRKRCAPGNRRLGQVRLPETNGVRAERDATDPTQRTGFGRFTAGTFAERTVARRDG